MKKEPQKISETIKPPPLPEKSMENFDHIELTMEEQYKCCLPVMNSKKQKFHSETYANAVKSGISQIEAVKMADEEVKKQNFELTPEELDACLKIGREEKHYRLKTNDYFNKLLKPVGIYTTGYEEFKSTIDKKLLELIGDKIDAGRQYNYLLDYFSNTKEGYNRNKGILIQGPVGCGKTTLMKAFTKNPMFPFSVVSCRQIARAYKDGGMNGIDKYMNVINNGMYPMYYNHREIGWCFDDLGTESSKKNYGDELNVMEEVLLNWYDRGNFNRIHITTNLTADEIEANYGKRVISRIREMFNLIYFEEETKDKRS